MFDLVVKNVRVVRPNKSDAESLDIAIQDGSIARLAADIDPAEAVRVFVAYRPEEHEPDPQRREVYDEAYRRYRDVYFALKPVFAAG